MATSTDNVKQLLEICDDSQVQEELDVLQAIFIDEIQEERDENGRPVSISIQLHPATAQDLQKQFVCVLLEMTLPPDYPDEPPEIVMKNPRGLGDEELLGLQAAMHDLARERRGGPMLYELIELAKESLTEGNIPRCPCVICLEHFNDGDLFTRTPCYHYYHNYCLGKYIQHRITVHEADAHPTGQGEFQIYCPVCREPLTYDLDALKASPPPIGDDILFEITPDIIRQQCEMELMLRNQKEKGGIIDVEAERNKLFIPSTPFLVPFTTEELVPNLDSDGGKKKPKVDVVKSHDHKGKPSRRQGYGRTTDKPARGPAGSNQSSNYSKGDRSQYHSQRKPNREEKYDAYYKHRRRNENRSTNGSNLNDQRARLPDERVRYDDGDLEVDGISEESGKEETDRSRNKGTYSRSQKHNLGPDRRKIVLKQNQEYSNDSDECTDSSRQLSVQNENERTQFEISNKIDKKGDNYERRPARQICNNKTSSHRKDYGRYKNDVYENYDNTDKENPRGSRRRDDDDESTGAYKHKERYSKVKRSDMSSPNGVRNPGDGDRTSKNCAISNKRNSDWRPRDTMREGMSENDQCQSAAIKESRSNNRQQLSLAKNEQIGTVGNKYHAKVLGSDGQRTNEMAALDGDGQRTNEMAALDRDGQRTNEMAALDSAEELTNEMAACAREINEALDSSSFCPSSMQHQSVDTRDVFQNGVKPEGRVSIRGRGFSKNKKELEDSKSLSDISQILMNPDSDKSGSVHSSEWVPKGTSQIKSASSATKSSMLTEDVKPSFKSKEWIPNDLPKQNHDVGNKNTVKSKTTSTGPPGFKVTRPPPGFQQNANDYRTPPGFGRVS